MTEIQAAELITQVIACRELLYNVAGFTLFTAVAIVSFGFFRGIKWVWDQLW